MGSGRPVAPGAETGIPADGTEILSVPASHPRELLPKVLSLASDAEVLEPIHSERQSQNQSNRWRHIINPRIIEK